MDMPSAQDTEEDVDATMVMQAPAFEEMEAMESDEDMPSDDVFEAQEDVDATMVMQAPAFEEMESMEPMEFEEPMESAESDEDPHDTIIMEAPSFDNTTDFCFPLGSEIHPFSWSKSVKSQSMPFQARVPNSSSLAVSERIASAASASFS